jgi:formylmethanofuran dehydrogenase subunit C
MSLLLEQKAVRFPAGLPIDARALSPDRMAGLQRTEIARLPILVGRHPEPLGDLFVIGGDAGDDDIVVSGDLASFARVGAGMTRGRLSLRGPVGACAGSGMSGGVLAIDGNAGPRAGEGMRGGALLIGGSAGAHLAAPLPGRLGLDRGTVVVRGSAGPMAALRMRRGLVAIGGDAGPGAGTSLVAGSLFILGTAGAGAGALMRRGTIVLFRAYDPLAVFRPGGRQRFPFLRLYADALAAAGLPLPPGSGEATYARFTGDVSGGGQGEILIRREPA